MKCLFVVVRLMMVFLPVLAGCASTGYPQTREEFLSAYNWGGIAQNVEHITVDRPIKTVVAEVAEFAKKCLDIKINLKRASRYNLEKYGSASTAPPVTYNTKVEENRNGTTTLSVQEDNMANVKQGGFPPGGYFTLVAEIRAAGKNKTQVDIYHLSKAYITNPLKQWIEGGKRACPSL